MQFKSLLVLTPLIASMSAVAVPFTINAAEAGLDKRQGTNVRMTWYDISVGEYVNIHLCLIICL